VRDFGNGNEKKTEELKKNTKKELTLPGGPNSGKYASNGNSNSNSN
jgi:hypothetical protein